MRRAGRIVGGLLDELRAAVQPGMKTRALDELSRAYLAAHGATPAFLGYRGFPATLCVSVNEEVVHGIPGERRIREGDLVSLDAGAIVDGWYADAAITVGVGAISAQARRLMDATRESLEAAIEAAAPGSRLSDISHAVQRRIERDGFGIVRDFVGHGIGRALHEDPPVPNFGSPNTGPRLKVGMALAIEPMVTLGGYDVEVLADGWTAVTRDRSLAAHFEHTIAITPRGAEVLTRGTDGWPKKT
jgi:methionyl aminopeptidase